MSSLSNIYIKIETLETLLSTLKAKGEKGISIDFSINNDTNEWGQNVSAYVSQTKEQREAKSQRFYVGNGKCFWTDGTINIAAKKEAEQVFNAEVISTPVHDDLPF
jgi:hypothetical protein